MLNKLKEIDGLTVLTDVNLERYTTYKIAATGKYLCTVTTEEALIKLLQLVKKEHMPYRILGGGSNIIFKQDVYEGILIKLALEELQIDENHITVGAGYSTQKLALKLCRLGYLGIEFATGIYGTIGGAIYNNAGAYKSDMGYIVKRIRVLTPTYEIETMENKEIDFHYRTSFLKTHPGYICLSAELELQRGNPEEIMTLVEDRRQRRVLAQPLEFPSAGSVFRNPEGNFAGKLIEDVGLKGYQYGKAKISEKHANFIITEKGVPGSDIVSLIQLIQEKVKEAYQIDLILEQEIVE